jgi:hypothetical protein
VVLGRQSEWITWLHRGLLALDIVLVSTLWPAYRNGWGAISWPQWSRKLVVPGLLIAEALAYAVGVETFPDEHIYLVDRARQHFGSSRGRFD